MDNAITRAVPELGNWRAYLDLCKPKVVALIVFTAIVGMLLAVPGTVPVGAFVLGSLGIMLASAAAAALNHVVDREADARMKRTDRRPLPSGALDTRRSVAFAAILAASGMFVLAAGVTHTVPG